MSAAKTAIVTGASRGIGRGIALTLAEAGWSVAVNYASNQAAADEVVELITKNGGTAAAIQADVAKAPDRQRLADRTEQQLGPITLLVNNAGISSPDRGKDLLETTEQSFDTIIATNVKSAHFMTQTVAKKMIAAGPADTPRSIINIGSISAFTASIDRADYCISRAATSMVTQTWAVRLAPENINVYEIRPGIIKTDMTAAVTEKYDQLIDNGLLPIARWGQPDDIGKAAATLASGSIPYSTGQIIHIDGGFHLRRL